jgi:hypothetical protein
VVQEAHKLGNPKSSKPESYCEKSRPGPVALRGPYSLPPQLSPVIHRLEKRRAFAAPRAAVRQTGTAAARPERMGGASVAQYVALRRNP